MGRVYDAVLLLSFGGPEGPDDVMPFLENVTRGRGVPRERLLDVAGHYQHFGGVSPINAQNRELLAAIEADFAAHGVGLPVYWGNRNWAPYVADTVRQMRTDGVRRALAFATSAFASYSGCRQSLDDIALASAEVGEGAPEIVKLRHYFDHPGFTGPHADAVRSALAGLYGARPHVVFTAHSIPVTMNDASGPGGDLYRQQLLAVARLVSAAAAPDVPWSLAWQSRSGPPQVPWLEPDVNDHLEALAGDGATGVVVSPIGFVSDHLEVVWDLDNEASHTAAKLGLEFARAATPGTDPRFVAMVRELVGEQVAAAPEVHLSPLGRNLACGTDGCCPVRPTSEVR
jgi:ferrochelatase